MKVLAVVVSSMVLVACGGGSSGGGTTSAGIGPSSDTSTYPIVEPVPVPISALVLGTPHADFTAPYGRATISLAGGISTSAYSALRGSYPAIDFTFQYLPIDHLTPDLASKVWANGWNGYGQSISVIDYFEIPILDPLVYQRKFQVQRTTTDLRNEFSPTIQTFVNNAYVGNYLVDYSYSQTLAHGELVSRIAAANEQGTLVESTQTVTPFAATTISCSLNGVPTNVIANASACANTSAAGDGNTFYGPQYSAWKELTSAPIEYHEVAGIAKSASVIKNFVDLSPTQNPYITSTYINGHIDNSYQSAAINLSFGVDLHTKGISLTNILDNLMSNPTLTRKSEAVVVVAAGNSYGPCGAADLAGCNFAAAYYAMAPQTRESTLVVGATTGTGTNEMMATYSTRAGALLNRFIVASGDTGYVEIDGSPIQGTSFAAPRVAAAVAIVRQKYPHLTAAQAANLLLLTASKDINNDGVDDFVGVSPIYGYGKLDLVKALSPIGTAAIGL